MDVDHTVRQDFHVALMRWLLPFLLVPTVFATSVAPELHECPVCEAMSVTMSLSSYSQFGEPARDLSDAPRFAFADVDVCPGDLFASWSGGWNAIQAGEKAKLTALLKYPALHLTAEEKSIIAGHEKEFRQSIWFLPLWARTCDEMRDLDERARFDRHLWLHFTGKFVASEDDVSEWEKRLVSLYQKNAIFALKNAAAAGWPTPADKRVFAYLRAELTRQAGRKADALALFREVMDVEKAAETNDELEWISRWAGEQSRLCGSDTKAPAKADESPATHEGRDEDSLGMQREMSWRRDVLLPAVRQAVPAGGLPAVEMPVDEYPFGFLPPLDGGPHEPSKQVFKELDRELYDLWQEQPPAARADIARIYIRMLKDSAETWESTQYPAMYFLPEIAETADGREAITRELDGAWKSSFWKAACAYAARIPDSGNPFVRHPFTGKADTSLVVKLLIQRSDASWMNEAIKKLNRDEWVSDEVIHYLTFVGLPEAKAALDQAAASIRKESGKQNARNDASGKLHTLRKIDELGIKKRLDQMPIR